MNQPTARMLHRLLCEAQLQMDRIDPPSVGTLPDHSIEGLAHARTLLLIAQDELLMLSTPDQETTR